MLATSQDTFQTDELYEPEYKRAEVADKLQITVRTLSRYILFGANYIPALKAYVSSDELNGKRILESHLKYLEEIKHLKLNYSPNRVAEILTKKYSPIEND